VLVLESLLAISILAGRSLLHILMLPDPAHSSCQVAVLFPSRRPNRVDVHVLLLEVRDGLLVQMVCGAEGRGGFGVDARGCEGVVGLGGGVGVGAVDCDVVEGLAVFLVVVGVGAVGVDGGGVVVVKFVGIVVGVFFVRVLWRRLDGLLEAVVTVAVLHDVEEGRVFFCWSGRVHS